MILLSWEIFPRFS